MSIIPAISHPSWCDPRLCTTSASNVFHLSTPVEFEVTASLDDKRLTVALEQRDEILRNGLVDTGTVTSGLVARTSLAYDLWGDAVSLAYRVRSVTGQPGIYVTQAVRDRMQDSVNFAEAGSVELRGKAQSVWRIE